MNGPALALLAEARRLDLTLRADGAMIRYRPVHRMPPDLAQRIKAHKVAIIAVLQARMPDSPKADAPGCPTTDAPRFSGAKVGPNRPVARGAILPGAAAAGGTVAGASVDGLDGGNVQVEHHRPPIIGGEGHEKAGLHQGDKIGVADNVGLPAGRDHTERLERLPVEQFTDGVLGAHTDSLASQGPKPQAAPETYPVVPVKWNLDALDRRVLLECGILPTPSPDALPEPWKAKYDRLAALMVKRIGLPRERAEASALKDVLRRMLVAGELLPEGW